MKRLNTVLLSLCLLAAPAVIHAQQHRVYAAVDYMNVPDEKSEQDYIALEKLWSRVHQKACDAGICLGWYLDRVENGGRNHFVTIRVYDSLDKMAEPWPDSLTKGLFSSQEEAQINQTAQVRHLTHRELWAIEASALKKMEGDPKHYALVNFMKPKPGKDAEYYKAEKELFSKIQKAYVDAGQMDGWFFMSRMFPSGYDAEFDYITADIFKDKAASEKSTDQKIAQNALTKEEFATAMKALEYRTVVRREVWQPILRVLPSKEQANK
jgi:hypothetical protein